MNVDFVIRICRPEVKALVPDRLEVIHDEYDDEYEDGYRYERCMDCDCQDFTQRVYFSSLCDCYIDTSTGEVEVDELSENVDEIDYDLWSCDNCGNAELNQDTLNDYYNAT